MKYQYDRRVEMWAQDAPQSVWTSYLDDTVLGYLKETPPEVKTSYIEVPASDGVIDLTDAVAGRPLYGRRQVEFTLHYIGGSRADAVEWAQDIRSAIHGRRLCISTMDSRAFEGYYVGRVSIEQEIERAHMVLTIHCECDPWIYYGAETVTLAAGSTTLIDDGTEIPAASRTLYPGALVTLKKRYSGSIGESTPHSVALVQSNSDNLIDAPRQCRIARYRLPVGDDWSSGWEFQQLYGASSFSTSTDKDYCYRYMVACSRPDADNSSGEYLAGMSFYSRKQYIGVKVSGTVTESYTGQQARVKIIYHGGTVNAASWGHARQLVPSAGGLSTYGTPKTQYVNVTPAVDGTFEQFAYIRSDLAAYDSSQTNPKGWATWGVEVSYATISNLKLEFYIGYDEPSGYVAPSNTVSEVSLPVGFYCDSAGHADHVDVSRVAPTLLTSLWDDSLGGVPTQRETPEIYQVGNIRPTGTPKWVWGYSPDFFGLYAGATVALAQTRTVDVDAGEMPTTMSIETSSPLYVTIDGKSYLITSSGYAPFAFSGEKTLTYTLYGTQAATISYEKGII